MEKKERKGKWEDIYVNSRNEMLRDFKLKKHN